MVKGDKGKGAETETRLLLGRLSSNLRMGIVGLPNVGKSSLFNILCGLSIPAENFPFCTIDPNEAQTAVPDQRFDWLVDMYKPASQVPAVLKVKDIAGLVRGAAEGQGLGNAFLSHIRSVDGIFHVVRVFEDSDVTHVEDSVDPVRDLEIIHQELRLKDIESIEKYLEANARRRKGDKTLEAQVQMAEKIREFLKEGKDIRHGEWNSKEIDFLNEQMLLTAKNVVYLLNLSERDYQRKKNKWLGKIKAWLDEHSKGDPIIPFSVALEANWVEMSEEERAEYQKEKKVGSALPKIIRTGYRYLNLINFFTCGADEVRAWTIRANTKAPQAAGAIHGDFEKGFVKAEVMKYDDLHELESEAEVKAKGKYMLKGKTYVVEDGDILLIKANTTGLTKKK